MTRLPRGGSRRTPPRERPGGREGRGQGLDDSGAASGFGVPDRLRTGRHGHLVWRSGFLPGTACSRAAIWSRSRPGRWWRPWRRDLTSTRPAGRPASTSSSCGPAAGWETLVPYVVSSPSAEGTVALVAPVTTWQSYNEWGGYSLYVGPDGDRRSWAVSFDRPYNGATGANDYGTAAIPVVVRAEALGIPLGYFTNVDLHQRRTRWMVRAATSRWATTSTGPGDAAPGDPGTGRRHEPRLPRRQHDVLADPARGPATGPARLIVGYRDDAALDPVRDERPEEATSRFRDGPASRP